MDASTHVIRTSDNVGVGYETAGIASRFCAVLLDTVLQAVIAFVAVLLLSALASSVGGAAVVAVLVFLPFFVMVAYYVVAETAGAGRTPGKRMLGLRVIRADGSAPGFNEALVRNIVRIVDLLGPGPVAMFVDERSRRLGDLAAGTVVVRERRVVPHLAPPPIPVLMRTPDAGPAIDGVERLGQTELGALRAFLSRPGLTAEQRHHVAVQMAQRLYERLGLAENAPERGWPAELFVERLYLQLAGRLGAWR